MVLPMRDGSPEGFVSDGRGSVFFLSSIWIGTTAEISAYGRQAAEEVEMLVVVEGRGTGESDDDFYSSSTQQ